MKFVGRLLATLAILTVMLAAGRGSEIQSVPPNPYVLSLEIAKVPVLVENNEIPPLQASVKKIKPITRAQIKCLTDNIYYEAGNQPWEGKLAVAFVTMRRLTTRGYPNSICGVVYEKKHPIYCQFSWTCENPTPPTRFNRPQWLESRLIAQIVVNYYKWGKYNPEFGIVPVDLEDPTHGALFFHNPKVSSPRWKTVYTQTARIADHDFYRK